MSTLIVIWHFNFYFQGQRKYLLNDEGLELMESLPRLAKKGCPITRDELYNLIKHLEYPPAVISN